MRLVFDTNVLFAAYITRGTCAALYELALASGTLLTSDFILDDAVLATAVAAGADFLVTGDKDLLILNTFAGIQIVTPAYCLGKLLR